MFCESKTLHVFIYENTSYAAGVLHIAKQYFISEFVGHRPDKFRFVLQKRTEKGKSRLPEEKEKIFHFFIYLFFF